MKKKNLWEEKINLTGLETETCWFMPHTTPQMIHYVKELGFNAVRLPVTWVGHLDENNVVDSKWMARVKEIADYVLKEDMYCIINVHHDAGGNGWGRACESSFNQYSTRLRAIYTQLANTFADYGEKLLFSGINEILDENHLGPTLLHKHHFGATNGINFLLMLFEQLVEKTKKEILLLWDQQEKAVKLQWNSLICLQT